MITANTIFMTITVLVLLLFFLVPAVKIIRRLKYAKNLHKINDGSKPLSEQMWKEEFDTEYSDLPFNVFNSDK